MIKGNKGEWSEIYVLLKIISQQTLYAGNENLEKIENLFFPILKVLRAASGGTYEFTYKDSLVLVRADSDEYKIPLVKFHKEASHLLSSIKNATGASFAFPETEDFLRLFNCRSLKARSSDKSDIKVVIHDTRAGINPVLGFSIKSQLGSSATLLNASGSTNFVFKVSGVCLSATEIAQINSVDSRQKIRDRIDRVLSCGGRFDFVGMQSKVFTNNLILIDSALPEILSQMLLLFFSGQGSDVKTLANRLESSNPLRYDLTWHHPFYSYKIKRFLTDIALGMTPHTVWSGKLDATGGYLIVKEDGEVLCYHIYHRNAFEDYLVTNTKFDTPSTSRHGFGSLYQGEEGLFFKLNLQIRFLK